MKSNLNEFLHYRALAAKLGNEQVQARMIDSVTATSELEGSKQVCTTLTMSLCDELESILSVLKMSKRQFIEQAIISAMIEAKDILDAHGVNEYHDFQAAVALGGAE